MDGQIDQTSDCKTADSSNEVLGQQSNEEMLDSTGNCQSVDSINEEMKVIDDQIDPSSDCQPAGSSNEETTQPKSEESVDTVKEKLVFYGPRKKKKVGRECKRRHQQKRQRKRLLKLTIDTLARISTNTYNIQNLSTIPNLFSIPRYNVGPSQLLATKPKEIVTKADNCNRKLPTEFKTELNSVNKPTNQITLKNTTNEVNQVKRLNNTTLINSTNELNTSNSKSSQLESNNLTNSTNSMETATTLSTPERSGEVQRRKRKVGAGCRKRYRERLNKRKYEMYAQNTPVIRTYSRISPPRRVPRPQHTQTQTQNEHTQTQTESEEDIQTKIACDILNFI